MTPAGVGTAVFLNCPFDDAYRPLLSAITFTVSDLGLIPRCALEVDDAAENRLDKIFRIVGECRFGIHDVSRTDPDPSHGLPRFNMPLELGIFLGCRRFGGRRHAAKSCLVLDREPFRYQKFISDIAGQDIHSHRNDPREAVVAVRNWLRTASGRAAIPGGAETWRRYTRFLAELPRICRRMRVSTAELVFADYYGAVREWLDDNPS